MEPTATAGPPKVNWEMFFTTLSSLKGLKAGWDSYRASPPSEQTILLAETFLRRLVSDGFPPAQVAPSLVGGVGFTFRSNTRKVYVELSNKGTVHVLFSDGETKPLVEPVPPDAAGFARVSEKAKAYLDE